MTQLDSRLRQLKLNSNLSLRSPESLPRLKVPEKAAKKVRNPVLLRIQTPPLPPKKKSPSGTSWLGATTKEMWSGFGRL